MPGGGADGNAEAVGRLLDPSPIVAKAKGAGSHPKTKYRAPWGAINIVLSVELCERLTYYTLAGSQKTYLNKQLGYTPSSAASVNAVFSMLCYMWCLPGGLLADSIGRHNVIVSLAAVYALGTAIVAMCAHSALQVPMRGLFLFGALFLVPLGTGGIKPNICNFGADQIGDETELQRDAQKKFFSFFYLAINVGVLFAFGFLVNVTMHGAAWAGIPTEEGYFAAYIVASAFMVLALCTFLVGTRFFKVLPGGGINGFLTMVRSVAHSVARNTSWRAWVAAVGWLLMPAFFAVTLVAALQAGPEEDPALAASNVTGAYVYPNALEEECGPVLSELRLLSSAALPRRLHGGGGSGSGPVAELLTQVALGLGTISCVCLVVAHLNNKWIKPPPGSKANEFTPEDVRAGFGTVPLIIVVNLAFSMAYNAMNVAFSSQASQMNTMMGGSQLNGAFFNLADALAIIIFTPLFESWLYPAIERFKGSPVRLGQKLVSGLLVAAAANVVAVWMEISRRKAKLMCWEKVSEGAPNGIHMRDISAFWMFIPFGMIGAAEVLVNPCMYYFAYTAAPPKVRSLVQAFNLFFSGSVSNAFTAVAMKATFPNDLDTGNLEWYYFLNVLCALVGVLLYFWLTRCGNHGEDIREEVRDEELEVAEQAYGETFEEVASSEGEENASGDGDSSNEDRGWR